MKTTILFTFIAALFTGSQSPSELNGVWLDSNTLSDTITFGTMAGRNDMLLLNRGKESRNGAMRPKAGSGPYYYKLSADKISLRWTLSSDASYKDFYFNQNGDIFTIENFFDVNGRGTMLTFKKMN